MPLAVEPLCLFGHHSHHFRAPVPLFRSLVSKPLTPCLTGWHVLVPADSALLGISLFEGCDLVLVGCSHCTGSPCSYATAVPSRLRWALGFMISWGSGHGEITNPFPLPKISDLPPANAALRHTVRGRPREKGEQSQANLNRRLQAITGKPVEIFPLWFKGKKNKSVASQCNSFVSLAGSSPL